MAWQYSPLADFLLLATVFLGLFTLFAWKRRRTPGIFPVLVIFAAATVWSAASAVALANTSLAMTVTMDQVRFPAIVILPVAYLIFSLWYTEHENPPSRLFLLLLLVIPIMSVILLFTNDLHHLFYTGFSSIAGPKDTVIWILNRGPLFWIAASYSLVLILTALILLVHRYHTVGKLFRVQILLILTAGIVPLLATLIYILDLGPDSGFDWTPVSFVISGFALIAAMLNFELFSLQPLTHSLLVRTMKDGVVATNEAGRITLINPAGSELLGVTEDRGVGQPLTGYLPELARFIAGTAAGKPEENEISLTIRNSPRIYEVLTVHLPFEDGYEGGYILSFRDVTDRKNAETAFQKANRKLGLLSSIIRHDINNRLTELFIYLDLAFETQELGEVRKDLDHARVSAEGIRDLIDFTREYQELGVTAPSWQNVGGILVAAAQQLNASGIRLVDETGSLEILADPLFQRVIYNLLDNALRYAEGMTKFSVRCSREDKSLILYVEDDGTGIPPDDKERIFQKGFGKNTGLGLFLSREILGITGITISETGEPGKGTRFEMMIPPGAYRFPEPQKE